MCVCMHCASNPRRHFSNISLSLFSALHHALRLSLQVFEQTLSLNFSCGRLVTKHTHTRDCGKRKEQDSKKISNISCMFFLGGGGRTGKEKKSLLYCNFCALSVATAGIDPRPRFYFHLFSFFFFRCLIILSPQSTECQW